MFTFLYYFSGYLFVAIAVTLAFCFRLISFSHFKVLLNPNFFFKQSKTRSPLTKTNNVWIHLSSLGEYQSVRFFIKEIKQKSAAKIIVTYFNEDVKDTLSQNKTIERYFPLPVENPFAYKRMIKAFHIKPILRFLACSPCPTQIDLVQVLHNEDIC